MAKVNPEKQTLEYVGKLVGRLREIQAQTFEVTEEIERVLGGQQRLGDILKDLEHAFDSAWCARYAPGRTGAYVWAYVKDRPQMKRLVRMLGVDELKARFIRYMRNDDPFYVKARHPFGSLVSSVNTHAAQGEAAEGFDLADQPPAGCKHSPPCRNDVEHTRRRQQDLRV